MQRNKEKVVVVKRSLPHGTNSTHFLLSVEEISILQNKLGLHNVLKMAMVLAIALRNFN
ncbi:hypothetical protein BC941DRAFT_442773 [Chlamydoabsidia padenii]|nr:hypothetical protein BC941DRAFT_442772 [Chlamydoabsidia padenii]KAI8329556.1 hypothetical protein BC941DRAFT_442773 [Chlamydoabsidia padenii]